MGRYWRGLAVGVLLLAGATVITTVRVIRHAAAPNDTDLEAILGLTDA